MYRVAGVEVNFYSNGTANILPFGKIEFGKC